MAPNLISRDDHLTTLLSCIVNVSSLVMAIGVFKLTKKQRYFFSIVFVSLNMIQVLTGVTMLSLSIYVYVSVAPVLYSERAEICFVFTVIGICGVNNICCYGFGEKIRRKCLKQAFKKSTRSLVFAWTCVTFYIAIYLAILGSLARKVYKHIIRTMGHSFYIGMSKYLKDQLWKISIDRIQFDMQCCGSHSYKEWYEIPWLNKYHVNLKSDTVKQFHENGTWTFEVTPWSCCRLNFPMQCLHDPLQQIRSHNVWADQHGLISESLNTVGCLTKLKIPIKVALTTFIALVAVNCIVQVFIFLIVRILYTACRNADILGDPNGLAPGWIFGRGDCGYSRGKTVQQIMRPRRQWKAIESSNPQSEEEEQRMLEHDN